MENSSNINSISLEDFFGQPKQAGSDFNWKEHKIEDGKSDAFRIAPPIKSLKTKGMWKYFHRLHYGYSVVNEQNPDKRTPRPFVCIEKTNRSSGMLEQDCPECTYLAKLNENLERLKTKAKDKGLSEEQTDEFLKTARSSVREHNLEKKWVVLAKNSAGEWGTLKLGYKTMQQLDLLISEYQRENEGAHPLDPKGGVWFRIARSGKGTATTYTISFEKESLGKGSYRLKSGELTLSDAQALEKCPDLATLNDSKVLNWDQIDALVKSNGDPTLVAQVFAAPNKRKLQQAAAERPQTPVSVPAKEQAPVEDDLDAQIAKLQAAKAAKSSSALAAALLNQKKPEDQQSAASEQKAPVQEQKSSKPVPSFNELMNLDPGEFLKMFPDPNAK